VSAITDIKRVCSSLSLLAAEKDFSFCSQFWNNW
jgi:hypothetical protein